MPRISSMDVTIAGTTRSFTFDPPAVVGSDDPGEASLELLADAETTEVELLTASVFEVSFVITRATKCSRTVTVAAEDEDAAREYIERMDLEDLWDEFAVELDDEEMEVYDVTDTGDSPDDWAEYDFEA